MAQAEFEPQGQQLIDQDEQIAYEEERRPLVSEDQEAAERPYDQPQK